MIVGWLLGGMVLGLLGALAGFVVAGRLAASATQSSAVPRSWIRLLCEIR